MTIRRHDLLGYLKGKLPQFAEELQRIHDESPDQEAVNVYEYLSDVLHWGAMETSLAECDETGLALCFEVIEDLLVAGDGTVEEALNIRVVPYLLTDRWLQVTRARAGSALQNALNRYAGNNGWASGVSDRAFLAEPRQSERIPVLVYCLSDRWFVFAQRQSVDRGWVDAAPLLRLRLPTEIGRLGDAIVAVAESSRADVAPPVSVTAELLALAAVPDRETLERTVKPVFVAS